MQHPLFNFSMNSEFFSEVQAVRGQRFILDSLWFIFRLSADPKWGNWQSTYNYSPFYLQGLWINKETPITSPTWIIQFTGAASDDIQTITNLCLHWFLTGKNLIRCFHEQPGMCLRRCRGSLTSWQHSALPWSLPDCSWIHTRLLRISVSIQRETRHLVTSASSILPLFQRPVSPSWVNPKPVSLSTLCQDAQTASLKIGCLLIASETQDYGSSRWSWLAQ